MHQSAENYQITEKGVIIRGENIRFQVSFMKDNVREFFKTSFDILNLFFWILSCSYVDVVKKLEKENTLAE